ncbi:MAG: hypothetical protein IT454_07610 [Planctomycetes bacterium]|nr:hypothetical protein [Planctomycetota bacterium]
MTAALAARAQHATPSRVAVLACSCSIALGVNALAVNQGLQRAWLEEIWLPRVPHGLELHIAAGVVALLATVATVLAWRSGRAAAALWPALRWAPVFALATWFALLAFPAPLARFDVQLAACVSAALWSALLGLAAWWSAPRWPRWLRRLEIVALELALCTAAAELGLRWLRDAGGSFVLASETAEAESFVLANRRKPGSPYFGFTVDSNGMVDEEPDRLGPEQPWVACIGDSFSVAVVPHHRHYTTIAERELGVPIYNLGVSSSGPREYRYMLERFALPRAPKLVVIALFIGNDIAGSDKSAEAHTRLWCDPRDSVLTMLAHRWQVIAAERREREVARAASEENPDSIEFIHRVGKRWQIERRMPWLRDPLVERETFTRERFLQIERTRLWFLLRRSLPRYQGIFDDLARLQASCGDTTLAVLLIPDEYQVDDALWEELAHPPFPADIERDLPQKALKAWLDEHGIPHLDLLPALRAAEPLADGKRHVYHLNDTHLNTRGNKIVGLALAEFVRSLEAFELPEKSRKPKRAAGGERKGKRGRSAEKPLDETSEVEGQQQQR